MQHTKLKIYSSAFLVISFLTYCIWLCYRIWHGTFLGLLNDEDYIYYDWKGVPIFLSLPGIVYGYLLCWCRILPFNKITIPFLLSFVNYVTTYLFAALVIGIILPMVVSFVRLGVVIISATPQVLSLLEVITLKAMRYVKKENIHINQKIGIVL